ncbi:hypothetical protein HDU96_009122 [Phlyctochytrium bullatum]|nr:hypothetical protein HDU96_009122 [Phlyctochytrium bullatum]
MKRLEEVVDPKVYPSQPFIIRLDGVSFSTFTDGLVKPFDWRLKDALVRTTEDLMSKFNPVTGFHHSDEISLVFPVAADPALLNPSSPNPDTISPASASSKPPKKPKTRTAPEPKHMYNGRVQKMASVTASYAAARLNYHLLTHDWSDLKPKTRDRIRGCEAYFDGRVVPLNDMKDAADCLFWRSNLDGFRNAISSIAQSRFHHRELHKKSLRDMVAMLKAQGCDFDREEVFRDRYLFGTFIKKEQYTSVGFFDPRANAFRDDVIVTRKRWRTGSFNFAAFPEDVRVEFVASKFWEDRPDLPSKDPLSDRAGGIESGREESGPS